MTQKIKPVNGYMQLNVIRETIGGVETDIAEDIAEVIAVPDDGSLLDDTYDKYVGKKVIFKVWALRTVKVGGEMLHFINIKSDGLLAIVED